MQQCAKCGAALPDEAVFCGRCGAMLPGGQEAAAGVPVSPSVREAKAAPARESFGSAAYTGIRRIFARYVMPAVSLLACLVLFISGFFINISYYQMEQVQAQYDISVDTSFLTMLANVPVEQNVFHVIGALTVGTDAEKNAEEEENITAAMQAAVQNVLQKYQGRIAALSASAAAGDAGAGQALYELYEEMIDDFASSVANINVIRYDTVLAELNYSDFADGTGGATFEQVEKHLVDTYWRAGLMLIYVAGYLFLQIVALAYLCLSLADLLGRRKKEGTGKFFCLYMIGCFAMFCAGQLTASSLNPVGFFCFVFAAVLCAVYCGMQAFCRYKFDGQGICNIAVRAVCAAVPFAALCILTGSVYEFGVAVDKIGAVFGKAIFNSDQISEAAADMTVVNFFGTAVPHLAVYVLLLIAFLQSLNAFVSDRSVGIALPIACLVLAVADIGVLYGLTAADTIDLLYISGAFVAVAVLCSLSVIFAAAQRWVGNYWQRKAAVTE